MKNKTAVKVLIADKNALYCHLFKQALKNSKEIVVVDIVQDYTDLLAYLDVHSPQIIPIDLDCNMVAPQSLVQDINSRNIVCKVLDLKMHFDTFVLSEIVAAGVRAILNKKGDLNTLLRLVHGLKETVSFISATVKDPQLQNIQNCSSACEKMKNFNIGKQEMETLILICYDKNTKEIAGLMKVCDRTIDRYKSTLHKITNTSTEAGLVLFALRNKIIML